MTTKPRNTGLMALCVGIVFAVGCDRVANIAEQARQVAQQRPLFEGDSVIAAIGQLRRAAGGTATSLQCLSITIDPDHAELQFESPGKPGNVDAYRYEHGVTVGPIPVRLMGGGTLQSNLFPCDAVKVDALPGLFADALRRLALEGGKVSSVRIRREFSGMSPAARRAWTELRRRSGHTADVDIPDGTIVVELSVSGTRKEATAKADAEGRILVTKVL